MSRNKGSVWYISKYANIARYGADTRQANFCREFVKLGFSTVLITSNSSHLYSDLPKFNSSFQEEKYQGYKVLWLNTLKYSPGSVIVRFLSWIHFEIKLIQYFLNRKIDKPDVVICSSLSLFSVVSGLILKRVYGTKFIFEVRDIWPSSLIELKGVSRYNPVVLLLSLIERLGYKCSDNIVGTMQGLDKHVGEVCPKDTAKKVTYIPHGVNLDFYSNGQKKIDSEYLNTYLPQNRKIVMYAGSLNEAYNLSNIIEVAQRFSCQDVAFVFIGDGPESERLKLLAKGIPDIYFAPKVDKCYLLSILECADVLIHSFMKKEVFKNGVSPNKFIDYLYAGKPILCIGDVLCPMLTDSGGGQIINPDNTALIDQEINRLISMSDSDKAALAVCTKNYLKEQLSYTYLAGKYVELFK